MKLLKQVKYQSGEPEELYRQAKTGDVLVLCTLEQGEKWDIGPRGVYIQRGPSDLFLLRYEGNQSHLYGPGGERVLSWTVEAQGLYCRGGWGGASVFRVDDLGVKASAVGQQENPWSDSFPVLAGFAIVEKRDQARWKRIKDGLLIDLRDESVYSSMQFGPQGFFMRKGTEFLMLGKQGWEECVLGDATGVCDWMVGTRGIVYEVLADPGGSKNTELRLLVVK